MLEIKHLTKKFGQFYALRDFSMTVNDGELFGFIGANGAGKSTTMKICAGLMVPDSGEVLIDGKPVSANHRELSTKMGYVPDFFGVYNSFSSLEYLKFFASTYGIVGEEAEILCMDLLKLVKLEHKAEADVNSLSRGMKQKMCLARALVHNPDIILLDEPASGLDPRARYELKEILRNLSSMGKTIIISSHILPELAEMCTSVGMIDKGHLMLQGTMEEINKAQAASCPLFITVPPEHIDTLFEFLKQVPEVQKVEIQGNSFIVTYSGGKEDESKLLATIIAYNIPIISFQRKAGSLESLFMNVVSMNAKRKGV